MINRDVKELLEAVDKLYELNVGKDKRIEQLEEYIATLEAKLKHRDEEVVKLEDTLDAKDKAFTSLLKELNEIEAKLDKTIYQTRKVEILSGVKAKLMKVRSYLNK